MNKKRLLGGVTWLATWLATISTFVLWFPIIAFGVLKLKDFITASTLYQASLTSSTSSMKLYEPEVVTDTTYALIFSVEDWSMMLGTLVLAIILWAVKIREHKKVKKHLKQLL